MQASVEHAALIWIQTSQHGNEGDAECQCLCIYMQNQENRTIQTEA